MDKRDIRSLVARLKRRHTAAELEQMSLEVVERLMALPRMSAARTILLYHSMAGEVVTHGLVRRLHAEGRTVLLPRVVDGERMVLVRYTGDACLRQVGDFHVLEPVGEPFTDYAAIDVAVVPGIAFTADGKRMGRGRGYYDRMLALMPQVWKVGLCFPFQLLDDIPVSPHDIMMDEVVA